MMKSIYDKMWTDAFKKIKDNELDPDPLIDNPNDSRRGITLQAKPEREILENISIFLKEAQNIEPGQYYYLPDEVHITVMSIINCKTGFNLSEINLPDYIECIEKSINNIKPFIVEFIGITASPSCILIQGFPDNDLLEHMRNRLRAEFAKGDIYNSIDARYEIKTAHCTVMRFKKELEDKQKFIGLLENYRNYNFGKSYINELKLVYTDWYHKNDNVQMLHKFTF